MSLPWHVWNMWVLDFMQKRFHNMNPGNFESMFIKSGDNKIKEGLRIEETRSQQLSEPRWS